MAQAFVVLTLLIMDLVVHAASEIGEPGLSRFCRHLSLDMPGGLAADRRVEEKNICKQVFPYKMKGSEARELCQYFAPFPIANVTEADDSVTCRWKSLTTCKDEKNILIRGKCMYLGMTASSNDTKDACPMGGKIHRVTDNNDARWITILLPSADPVYVANRMNDTSRKMMVNDLIWDGYDFRNDVADVDSLALLMRTNDLHRTDAGKIIKVDKEVRLKVVCSDYAVTYAGADDGESVWNMLPEGLTTSGNKRVIVTSNVYQPTATSNIDIDTKNFHDVCKKICQSCFVALSGTSELTVADEITYIPARLSVHSVKEYDKPQSCTKRGWFKEWFHEQLRTTEIYGAIEESSWESTYPDNMCADTFRTAVVSQKNGKIKDSPAITRHRLTCVVGEEPGVEPFSLCRANSEPDGNGGCKCKEGYIDVTKTTREEANWFAEGQFCVLDKLCGWMSPRPVRVYVIASNCKDNWNIMYWMKKAMDTIVQEFPPNTQIVVFEHFSYILMVQQRWSTEKIALIRSDYEQRLFNMDSYLNWDPKEKNRPEDGCTSPVEVFRKALADAQLYPNNTVKIAFVFEDGDSSDCAGDHYDNKCTNGAHKLQTEGLVRLVSIPYDASWMTSSWPLIGGDFSSHPAYDLRTDERKSELVEKICKKHNFDLFNEEANRLRANDLASGTI